MHPAHRIVQSSIPQDRSNSTRLSPDLFYINALDLRTRSPWHRSCIVVMKKQEDRAMQEGILCSQDRFPRCMFRCVLKKLKKICVGHYFKSLHTVMGPRVKSKIKPPHYRSVNSGLTSAFVLGTNLTIIDLTCC